MIVQDFAFAEDEAILRTREALMAEVAGITDPVNMTPAQADAAKEFYQRRVTFGLLAQ
ncbi:hypothetical protein JQK15_21310 [Sphingobium sp. BHU LFT2]|uniref:hypothetical protein n=1 Tax=Sphingobium sp. BHU LFT2 TaxID=2807634 RepID=UPI001BE85090|nr:hypothetical protein [Sphingobium sp. BHU LFT2]MBT2246049.1 hypothetical protein [Sphingobium sp. BHU LFT2]